MNPYYDSSLHTNCHKQGIFYNVCTYFLHDILHGYIHSMTWPMLLGMYMFVEKELPDIETIILYYNNMCPLLH